MEPLPIHQHRIEATLKLQFPGLETSDLLKNISVQLSGSTKRIRSIFSENDELLFSLRVLDGHFIPTIEGGKAILDTGYEGNQIVMNDEATPYVTKGKTAFCKHVLEVDNKIVPNTEILLVDKNKNLLAVGSALHPAYAILELNTGPAVKVRHGIER